MSYDVSIFVPGGDGSHAPVVVATSTTLDLLSVVTPEELESMQGDLLKYIASGALTEVSTVSDSSLDEGSPSALIVQSAVILQQMPPLQPLLIIKLIFSLWLL